MSTHTTTPTIATRQPPRHLRPKTRRALLSMHVISSVGLLGASSALLLLAITAASTSDPELAHSAYRFMSMFGFVFGIPLSFSALITGVVLGLGSKWGVLRYPWVTIKLGLLLTTILSGALVIGRVSEQMADGTGGSETQLLVAGAYNVVALVTSTILSIYKPGRRRGPARRPRPA
jgi:uncharacterized membrane protein